MKKHIALCLALLLVAGCYMVASAKNIEPITQESAGVQDLANDEIDYDDLTGKNKPVSMFFPAITITEQTDGRWVEYEGGRYYHYNWQDIITYKVTFANGNSVVVTGTQFTHQGKTYSLSCTDPQSPTNPWVAGNTYQIPVSLGDVTGTAKFTIKAATYQAGDVNGDKAVNNADVILLLWHTLFPESYSLATSGDVNGDNAVNNADVIQLLWHTLFPESYPLA